MARLNRKRVILEEAKLKRSMRRLEAKKRAAETTKKLGNAAHAMEHVASEQVERISGRRTGQALRRMCKLGVHQNVQLPTRKHVEIENPVEEFVVKIRSPTLENASEKARAVFEDPDDRRALRFGTYSPESERRSEIQNRATSTERSVRGRATSTESTRSRATSTESGARKPGGRNRASSAPGRAARNWARAKVPGA